MRPKYYRLSLKKIKIKKRLLIFLILFSLSIMAIFSLAKRVEPVISSLCEAKTNSIALQITNKSVDEYVKGVKYENLVDIKTNEEGKIVAINANVMEMNRLATLISSQIQEEISKVDETYINLPLGSVFNMGIFSGMGPKFRIDLVPVGFVSTKFDSIFEAAGINQTRHRIFVVISTKMRVVAPFYTNIIEYKKEVVVAEMILVGDTPNAYYNVNGYSTNLNNLPNSNNIK